MTFDRRRLLQGMGAIGIAGVPSVAWSQTRAETLRYVTANTINTLDTTMFGATRESFGLSMNVYDRLFSFGRKRLGANWVFDATVVHGELAAGYRMSPDNLKITVELRPDATWHDGSPVTAEDIKWSLDRAVQAKSLAPPQISTGSITDPGQFAIIDPHTIEITLPKPDRLALANLCVPYAIMVNSKLAKAARDGGRPVGTGMDEDQHRGERRLHRGELSRGRERHPAPQRGVEGRPGRHPAGLPPHHRADGAGTRDARQPDRKRRR